MSRGCVVEIVFGFIAGLFTLINPCVITVLQIALASALQAGQFGPVVLAAGMSIAFVTFGMTVATVGHSIGLTESVLTRTSAILMMLFGLLLLVPQLNRRFAAASSGLGVSASEQMDALPTTGLSRQFVGGLLLGAVWSPCIGPTLGGAISMASQGESLFKSFLVMLSFAVGVSTVIVGLGYGTREAVQKRQKSLRALSKNAKNIMGITFLLVGAMIYFELHHILEVLIINIMPFWL